MNLLMNFYQTEKEHNSSSFFFGIDFTFISIHDPTSFQGEMAQLPCSRLYKPCTKLPFGDCAMYFDYGVTEKSHPWGNPER